MRILARAILVGGMVLWTVVVAVAWAMRPRYSWPAFDGVVALVAAGMIVLTTAVGTVERHFATAPEDHVFVVARSISRGLALAFLALFGVAILSAGLGVVPELVIGALVIGAIGGTVHGAWNARRPPGHGAVTPRQKAIDWRFPLFMLGCLAAVALLVPVALVANQFRGPISGYSELGTSIRVDDQRPVNRALAAALAGLAWSIGAALAWRRVPPAFIAGLVTAATLLAIAFAQQM